MWAKVWCQINKYRRIESIHPLIHYILMLFIQKYVQKYVNITLIVSSVCESIFLTRRRTATKNQHDSKVHLNCPLTSFSSFFSYQRSVRLWHYLTHYPISVPLVDPLNTKSSKIVALPHHNLVGRRYLPKSLHSPYRIEFIRSIQKMVV